MARSLPTNRAVAAVPPVQTTGGVSLLLDRRLLYPLPPLLLAGLAMVLLVAAYLVRPTVNVDMGSYYDAAFLRDFHAREVDAAGAGTRYPWAADSTSLTIPGGHNGDHMITVQAPPELPGRPLSGVALSVNGEPVSIPRDSSHSFTAFVPAELAASETLTLELRPALTGGPEPPPGIIASAEIVPARTYRWSRGESQMVFSGLGQGAWLVSLDMVTRHPAPAPVAARLSVNAKPLASLPDSGDVRRVSLLVPPHLMHSGTLALTLHANEYRDPRPLGVLVADAQIAPVAGSIAVLPPWHVGLATLTMLAGLYSCLAVMLSLVLPWQVRRLTYAPLWLAAGLAATALALLAWGLAWHRYPTSQMVTSLAGLALWSLVLLAVLLPLLHWLVYRLGVREGGLALVGGVLLIFFASYWLKAAGMLYPYFIGIDIHWHMERARWILGGQLPLLYGTDSPLNESTMPVAEWGSERPVIPYSPYFHLIATSFALLPWRMEFTANMVSALLDSSRILLVGLFVLLHGVRHHRAALFAALLMAVLPINYLLLSWGNMPTTMGLWFVLLATLWLLATWHRLPERGIMAVLVLLLVASFLVYTVAGVFTGLFVVGFSLALWLATWRSGTPALRGSVRWLWLATAIAAACVTLVYYGQYFVPIVERTIPYIIEAFTAGHEDSGRASDTLSAYLLRHERLFGYGIVVPLILTAVYLGVTSWRAGRGATAPSPGAVLLWAAIVAWVGIMLLFVPAAYTISMVDKHFLAALPFVAVASALVFNHLWQRGWLWRLGISAYYGYLALAAIQLWLHRVVSVQQIYD